MDRKGLGEIKEFIHLDLLHRILITLHFPLAIKDAVMEVYLPMIGEVFGKLIQLGRTGLRFPMLSRTHGQPASPTRLGKEISVFC